MDIDRTDFGILKLLMDDSALSNKQIAAEVELAPSSCHERIKTLRKEGILLGSHAEVNFQALGLALEALLFVQVAKLEATEVDNFVRMTASVCEVRNVFLVSGRFDLVVHLVVRDMLQLKRVISERFNAHPCVIRVETSIVFNRQSHHSMPIAEVAF